VPKEISLQRLVEDRLAHRADRGFHLVDARALGHPAGFQVQHRDLAIVAFEHREEILREVILVARIQRADDAEIHRGVLGLRRVFDQHEDVARVHVGVEEVVPEHLREEDLHAVSARRLMSVPTSRSRVMLEICTPRMRSSTMTAGRQ
jgi:hypothetical protein